MISVTYKVVVPLLLTIVHDLCFVVKSKRNVILTVLGLQPHPGLLQPNARHCQTAVPLLQVLCRNGKQTPNTTAIAVSTDKPPLPQLAKCKHLGPRARINRYACVYEYVYAYKYSNVYVCKRVC